MKTVDEIVTTAGGAAAVCAARGVSRAALRKWRQFGAVPPAHHIALIRLSGGALSLDDFTSSAAGGAEHGVTSVASARVADGAMGDTPATTANVATATDRADGGAA